MTARKRWFSNLLDTTLSATTATTATMAMVAMTAMTAMTMMSTLGVRPAFGAGAATSLGQVASRNLRLDGVWVPAGTTLLSPAVLTTGPAPGLVELRNGRLLALADDSEALLTGTLAGGIEVAVRGGSVAYRSAGGEVMTLGKSSLLLLDQEGQILEGTEIARQVGMCHLLDWELEKALRCLEEPDRKECKWELIEVDEEAVDEHLEQGDVIAGNNDIGLDEDCKKGKAGLSPLKQTGIGVAAALLAAFFLDDDDDDDEDDDEEPASPIRP